MLVSATSSQINRYDASTRWTEQYKDRVKALLESTPNGPTFQQNRPIRGILLQDVYGGQDGLMSVIARDGGTQAYLISIVGINTYPNPTPLIPLNPFQLQLSGTDADGVTSIICTTAPISSVSTASDVQSAIVASSRLTIVVSVGLGNPYFDPRLFQYGNVVAPQADGDYPASYLGMWYIKFDDNLGFDSLSLAVVNQTATTLSNIVCIPILDLLSPGVEQVTDTSYRTKDYPWQAGSIVTCLDYSDIGYGIISSTARTIDVQ